MRRPFFRRAGIWWINLTLGLLYAANGAYQATAGSGVLAAIWLLLGLASLATAPVAYRQNVADAAQQSSDG
jgi:hypothetical protein